MKVGPLENYPKDRLVLRDHPSKQSSPRNCPQTHWPLQDTLKTFGQAINQITHLLNPNIDLKKKGTQASEDSMSGIANRCTVITNHGSFLHISGSNQILLNEKACNIERPWIHNTQLSSPSVSKQKLHSAAKNTRTHNHWQGIMTNEPRTHVLPSCQNMCPTQRISKYIKFKKHSCLAFRDNWMIHTEILL